MKNRQIFYNAILFCVMTLFLIVIGLGRGNIEYCWDAKQYYDLSKGLIADGRYELIRFPICNRGVIYPAILAWILLFFNFLGLSDNLGIIFFNAIGITILFWIVIDKFLKIDKRKNKIITKSVGIAFFAMYWSDYIVYPLTDVWALLFMIGSCFFLKKAVEGKLLRNYFFSGITAICAYNTRAIYIVAIVPLLIVGVVVNRKQKPKEILLRMMLIFCGMFVMSLPQFYVNWNNYEIFSPFIVTSNQYDGGLFLSQLLWGMGYQRYDTFVGDVQVYPITPMRYLDLTGNMILNSMEIVGTPSIWEYCRIWLNYPFEMLGVLGRHIINGVSMPFRRVYVDDLQYVGITLLLNYILFILVILSASAKCNKKISPYYWLCLVPVVAISFGSIETRFFLPVYIIVYSLIGCIDYKKLWICFKNSWIKMMVFVGVYIIIGYSVTGSAFKNLDYPILFSW